MSETGHSGNLAGPDSGKSGGTSRRKRNYRHFGPGGTSGDISASPPSQGGARMGPVELKQESRNTNRDTAARESSARPAQTGKTASSQQKTALPSDNRNSSRTNKNRRNRSNPNRQQNKAPAAAVPAAEKSVERAESTQTNQTGQKTVKQNQPVREKQVRPDQQQKQIRKATGTERSARWERKIQTEENYEDIRRDIDRIEKEIWLEIAGLHTIKLDY